MKKIINILKGNSGWGLAEVLTVVVSVVIVALLIAPTMKGVASSMVGMFNEWWAGVSGVVFSQ